MHFAERNQVAGGLVVLVLGYTLGYVLRLFSPDELDSISGKHVRQQMPECERDVWPYTGCPGDKFPYFCTRRYLEARDLTDAAELVTWGPDKNCQSTPACDFHAKQPSGAKPHISAPDGKRSKTVVNGIRLELAQKNADFAAFSESNEAHIRLMFGAWLATRWAWRPVLFGTVTSMLYLIVGCCGALREWIGIPKSAEFVTGVIWCSNLFCLEVVLLLCMWWIAAKIQSVFHYRRVGELVYVLQAWAICRRDEVDKVSA